jgi:hypothetical protein
MIRFVRCLLLVCLSVLIAVMASCRSTSPADTSKQETKLVVPLVKHSEYKVVGIEHLNRDGITHIERVLNQYATQGWRLHTIMMGPIMVFERQVP